MFASSVFFVASIASIWYNLQNGGATMSKILRLCLIVTMILVLCGCNMVGGLVRYDQMEYQRPDMVDFNQVLEESCSSALEEQDIQKLENKIIAFYQVYDQFYTNMNLAFIRYSQDLTDLYWEAEYAYCTEHSTAADAGLDRLYRCLAKSPLRETLEGEDYFGEEFFKNYDSESIYDEYMVELMTREAQLQARYQAINGESVNVTYYSDAYFTQYGSQMAQVFLELVQLRQQIASYAGYDSYVDFAYDFYHLRDYTPSQAVSYLTDIRAELVPLYTQLYDSGFWNFELEYCTESDMLQYMNSATKAMGGTVRQAFTQMQEANVYDIRYSTKKYNTSFEIYLSAYATPYVFVCPTGTAYDKLTFAHEFGHFCCDYASGGANQGIDVAEIFSQAMEYLSLTYAADVSHLEKLKLADSLSVYIEQAAYASFEHQVYGLEGDALTIENIQALYEQIISGYGMDVAGRDGRDYVCISHFYESPLYVISYVLSNDAALQIYELEQAQKGQGLECFVKNMTSNQPYILAFLTEAGLQSPFADGRLTQVKDTFSKIWQ